MGNVQILNNSTRRILLADFLDYVEDILRYRMIKILCAPDENSTKIMKKYFKQFQSLTMIT
jgi:5S rRNA maturation endonuclease (ribonuclease M5)